MNREGDRGARHALRSQKPTRAQQQQQSAAQKKKKESSFKDAQSFFHSKETQSAQCDSAKDVKTAAAQLKRPEKAPPGVPAECQRSPGAQRKLSDASNASEDLSKDSGCVSGKLSSSDSSSDISDDGTKQDSELIWTEGRAYVSLDAEEKDAGKPCVKAASEHCALRADAAGGGLGLFHSSGAFMDLMMGETTEDLVREVEDLRSENDYLKDELEELRCEMVEMRDLYQEEDVLQLQELRLQLEQANKTCRILQYRLRKAERRSIRVAKTGQVDGELVRTLEHDIKVAKSVSMRLYNELETVQKKNSQLELENEALREKTQEMEVAKQVLQAEVEKARESSLKKKSIRSTANKEKRLSLHIEDDSAELKCQLHFAKEELALMCKKLTKLVSENEGMHERLAKYHSAYGDLDAAQTPEGKKNGVHAREAEVKVHLKLVEEEAMLLSRRIVELEVENRGLRAEMSDLREKTGGGGGEEEEEERRNAAEEKLPPPTPAEDGKAAGGEAAKSKSSEEASSLCSQSQAEGAVINCHIPREGPVGGEWNPSDACESDGDKKLNGLNGMTLKDFESLLTLRDHACILSSAIQLLTAPPRNGHCSSPPFALTSPTDVEPRVNTQAISLPGPLNEAVELLQAMLLTFIGRVETLLIEDGPGKPSLRAEGHAWDTLCGGSLDRDVDHASPSKQECIEDLSPVEKTKPSFQWELIRSCRDPKMKLSLQILWILHQWCQVKGPGLEGKESRDKTVSVLLGLLQNLGTELRDERIDNEAKATRGKAAESALSIFFREDPQSAADRTCSSKGKKLRRQFSPCYSKKKNWCYLSQEAAQVDQEDPVRTWDHLIMPLSFPDLDFEQMSAERSHTAPEKSTCRIYYSPPSARRVQQAQLKKSPVAADDESVDTTSPWCTPPTSFSPLCLGSATNLSDDMKEMTAGWRQPGQPGHGGSQAKRGKPPGRWVDVVCSGTQTHTRPQMVSVGLQTDGAPATLTARSGPHRALNSSLVSARTHHISGSLDRVTGRVERTRPSASSPKLHRRHSASGASSPKLYRRHSASGGSSALSSSHLSSPPASASRGRAQWNLPSQSHAGLIWTRQTSHRSTGGQSHSPLSAELSGRGGKPACKSAGANRYGLVSEFLRRVSGRAAEKPTPEQAPKTKGGLKGLERAPTRPHAAPLHRNDSVTRIVNQRFMRQREERGSSPSHGLRHSRSSTAGEDGSYDCSSSSTLTFCFARPSRSAQRQAASQSKLLHRHRYSPPVVAVSDAV